MNKEFKVGCTYSDKRGNKWKITGNDNVGCFPLLAQCETVDTPDYPFCDEFTTKGGYQEDEPSDFDLVWQPQSDYALLEFKRKCNDFNVISGKTGVPSSDDLKNQVRLITEESKELLEAFENESLINTLQELTDVLVVSFGLLEQFRKLNYDVDGALLAVADCNLSKFTDSYANSIASSYDYSAKNINVDVSFNKEYRVYVIKDTKDKVRKPIGFKKVNLEEFKPKYETGGDCSTIKINY